MRVTTRVSASLLLVAAFAMVFETSCSHAPSAQPSPQPVNSTLDVRSRLALYAEDGAVIRIHTAKGTIIPTGRYSVMDSVVVIDDVLRGEDYIPELAQAHLYGRGPAAKELSYNVTLPLTLSVDQIVAVESWNFPPRPAPTGREVRTRLAVYAAEKVVARIHTVDGTIIPTSRYEVIDSVLVIENVLRGNDYFPEENHPHVYGDYPGVKKLPTNVKFPLRIPIDQVATVERWQNPHTTEKGVLSGILIFGAVAVVVASVIALYRSAFKNSPWEWN